MLVCRRARVKDDLGSYSSKREFVLNTKIITGKSY